MGIGHRQVDCKHNEITEFKPLLEPLDLRGRLVTADAMHTQKGHARFLVEDKHADELFIPEGTQGSWEADLQALSAAALSPPAIQVEKAHGWLEIRKVQTSTALNGYLDSPHVAPVFQSNAPPR